MIEEFEPEAIWTTYPIATAHVIGAALHRRLGRPWGADFRDPMAYDGYPSELRTRQAYTDIQVCAAAHVSYCAFTIPGAARSYACRCQAAAGRMVVVQNAYDEGSFSAIRRPKAVTQALGLGFRLLVLLYSGILFRSERNPTQLFVALARVRENSKEEDGSFRVRFPASVDDNLIRSLPVQHGVLGIIELCPPMPNRTALTVMGELDALLVMQANNCNEQVPAKVYEYLRAGRRILALTDLKGDTEGVLRQGRKQKVARLDSTQKIEVVLVEFGRQLRDGTAGHSDSETVRQMSRRERSRQLAGLSTG